MRVTTPRVQLESCGGGTCTHAQRTESRSRCQQPQGGISPGPTPILCPHPVSTQEVAKCENEGLGVESGLHMQSLGALTT